MAAARVVSRSGRCDRASFVLVSHLTAPATHALTSCPFAARSSRGFGVSSRPCPNGFVRKNVLKDPHGPLPKSQPTEAIAGCRRRLRLADLNRTARMTLRQLVHGFSLPMTVGVEPASQATRRYWRSGAGSACLYGPQCRRRGPFGPPRYSFLSVPLGAPSHMRWDVRLKKQFFDLSSTVRGLG
jgi:hypothetical protein